MVYVDPRDGFPAWLLPLEVLLEIAEEREGERVETPDFPLPLVYGVA